MYPESFVTTTSFTSTRLVTSDDSDCTCSIVGPAWELRLWGSGRSLQRAAATAPAMPIRIPATIRAMFFHMQFLLSLPAQNTEAAQRSLFIEAPHELQQDDQHDQQNERRAHVELLFQKESPIGDWKKDVQPPKGA